VPRRLGTAMLTPDYSRQISLKEIGAQGQAALTRSRVLIVGAGGLGSPVLQYLAGAGVGCLGVVEADTLDPSNLHRQPIYDAADVDRPKIELAAAAIKAINPTVRVEIHEVRLDADNALGLVQAYDLVIDCSDNFRTKYLINDAAVLAKRPAIFASVYQYEGQLQVYKPDPGHACLRCLWPDAVADGIVGNCAEAGVLGPVPGTFGSLQALIALKILLQIPGQLTGELLLLDFMNFSSVKIKAVRLPECRSPGCAHITEIPPEADGDRSLLEISLNSRASAAQRGFEILDIRTAAEVAAQPSGLRQFEMSRLLADSSSLPAAKQYLLVCASGKRSLTAARELRRRGLVAHSLAGGLQNWEA
jgi:sulfur-carrier protein adenylyltransferase/sulfurtransferase